MTFERSQKVAIKGVNGLRQNNFIKNINWNAETI